MISDLFLFVGAAFIIVILFSYFMGLHTILWKKFINMNVRNLVIAIGETKYSKLPTLQILEQSHRGILFTPTGNQFTASDGFVLKSSARPQVKNNILFVRGSNKFYNSEVITIYAPLIPKEYIERVKNAVKEYNEAFNIGEDKL